MRRAITARSITSATPCRIGSLLVDNIPSQRNRSSTLLLLAKTDPFHDQFCKIQRSPLSIWSLVSPLSSKTNYNDNDNNNNNKQYVDMDDSQHQKSSEAAISMPTRQQQVLRPADCDLEIARLLGCPNDAILDAPTWVKADSCVLEAVEEGNFFLAFELIDRMAKDPKAPNEMNNEVLFTVVQEWLMAYGRYVKTPNREKPPIYLPSPINVWRRIERYLENGIPIDSRTIHRILDSTAVVKSKKLNGPALAETILQRMMDLSKRQNPDIRPSVYTFNAVIASWEAAATVSSSPTSKVALQEAPERAMMLLERLKGLYAAGWGEEFMPNRRTYRRVMNLYAHRGEADQVEALMEEFYALYQKYGYSTLLPTPHMFSIVLYAWSKSNDPEASERADTLLQHMLQIEKEGVIPGFKVNSFCFNIVMLCWSKQRSGESAQKAQGVFDQMLVLSENDPSKRPIPGSYATLIYTWSFHDPKKAEEALWAWRAESNSGTCPMRMDNKVFTSLLSGWFHSKDPDAAMRCDRLLKYALDGQFGDSWWPQAIDFNMTINAYCRRNNPQEIERAEAMLEEMTDEKHKSKGFFGATSPAYVSVIHALARLGRADRADKWLHQWFAQNDRTNSDIDTTTSTTDSSEGFKKKQSHRTLNRVLKAWMSKALVMPEASTRAEELLLKMEGWGVKANMGSFQLVLECRKKNQKEFGVVDKLAQVDRANRILAMLDREYASGALNSDKATYLAVRREWALEAI